MFARARNKKELKRNEKVAIKELKDILSKEEMKYFMSMKDEEEILFDKEDKKGKEMYNRVTGKVQEWMISKMNRGTLYFYIITPMELSAVLGFGYDSVFSGLKNEKGELKLYLVGCGTTLQAIDELIKVDLNAIKGLRDFAGSKEKLKDYLLEIKENLEEDNPYEESSFLEIIDSAVKNIDYFFDEDNIVVSKFKLNLDGTIEPVSDISCKSHRKNYELVKLNHNIEKDTNDSTCLSFVVKEVRQKFQVALYQNSNKEEVEEHIEKIDEENILQEVLTEIIMTENDKIHWSKESINLLFYQFFGLDKTMYKILKDNNCTNEDIKKFITSNSGTLNDSIKVINENNYKEYFPSMNILFKRNALTAAFRKMCSPEPFMNSDTLNGKNLIKTFLITTISGALVPLNTILNIFEWEMHQKKNNIFKAITHSNLEDKEEMIDVLNRKFGDTDLQGGKLN